VIGKKMMIEHVVAAKGFWEEFLLKLETRVFAWTSG
jgi:hypothetical protein